MFSNERPSPFHKQPYHQPYAPQQHRPFVPETTLASGKIQIERKSFLLALKENPRGRFLRITEEVGDRHNSVIIPSTGLVEFMQLLGEIVQASNKPPVKNEPVVTPEPIIEKLAPVPIALEVAEAKPQAPVEAKKKKTAKSDGKAKQSAATKIRAKKKAEQKS